jgi:hypothetical protein
LLLPGKKLDGMTELEVETGQELLAKGNYEDGLGSNRLMGQQGEGTICWTIIWATSEKLSKRTMVNTGINGTS